MSLADLRQHYTRGELIENAVAASPFEQFDRWFAEAREAAVPEANAMTLATADASGQPSARTVLLKGADSRGFVFYTNYQSRKGLELARSSRAALLFFWPQLERQVRIEGHVVTLSAEESDAYYRSRPLPSRIGAWASPQSQEIDSRAVLDQFEADAAERLGDNPPRPPHWGGYRVVPHAIEFWQGRPSRLHDRLVYRRQDDGSWQLSRLAP